MKVNLIIKMTENISKFYIHFLIKLKSIILLLLLFTSSSTSKTTGGGCLLFLSAGADAF